MKTSTAHMLSKMNTSGIGPHTVDGGSDDASSSFDTTEKQPQLTPPMLSLEDVLKHCLAPTEQADNTPL